MNAALHKIIEVWNSRLDPKDSSRRTLRKVLSRYLNCDPASIRFEHNENGKPFLPGSELQFNLSHSRDRLLIAVTAGRDVGIDIEYRRPNVNMNAIAERWFSKEEQEFFQGLEQPEIGFFDIWAKKEAFVKALGSSIFHGLSSFTVPLGTKPGIPMPGTSDANSVKNCAATLWYFQTLEIHPACSAALVYEGPRRPVRMQTWPAEA